MAPGSVAGLVSLAFHRQAAFTFDNIADEHASRGGGATAKLGDDNTGAGRVVDDRHVQALDVVDHTHLSNPAALSLLRLDAHEGGAVRTDDGARLIECNLGSTARLRRDGGRQPRGVYRGHASLARRYATMFGH